MLHALHVIGDYFVRSACGFCIMSTVNANADEHIHYEYVFGETFCRRKTTRYGYNDMDIAKCRSTEEKILVGGGKNFCTFVLKHKVTYEASKPKLYQTPPTRKGTEKMATSKTTLSRENLDTLFNFTFHLDMGSQEGTPSSAKRMKLQFTSEMRQLVPASVQC